VQQLWRSTQWKWCWGSCCWYETASVVLRVWSLVFDSKRRVEWGCSGKFVINTEGEAEGRKQWNAEGDHYLQPSQNIMWALRLAGHLAAMVKAIWTQSFLRNPEKLRPKCRTAVYTVHCEYRAAIRLRWVEHMARLVKARLVQIYFLGNPGILLHKSRRNFSCYAHHLVWWAGHMARLMRAM
jgi:hypothetical protein